MTSMVKPGYCTLCRSRCGTLNEISNDRLITVTPDKAHPTGKAMCMKGRAAPELIDSPHRQLYPLCRTAPKGAIDPKWERISWEEALSEVASKLARFKAESGAESVAFAVTTPSGTPLSDSIDWIERFIRYFGSPNTCYATEICNWHKDVAHAFTFGTGIPPADYEHADVIVLWGHNPANTWLAQADAIARGRRNGAKLIVIDPRPTSLAKQADVWLRVHPGTDAAIALGLIRELVENDLWDECFTRSWTNAAFLVRLDTGEFLREQDIWARATNNRYVVWNEVSGAPEPLDPDAAPRESESSAWALTGEFELAAQSTAASSTIIACTPAFALLRQEVEPFTIEHTSRITGADVEALRAAARLLRRDRRIAYHSWTGVGQHSNATQTERSLASLYALTGSFDRIGANRVRRGPPVRSVNGLELMHDLRSRALGYDERPLGPPATGWITARDLYRAITKGAPYKVRALIGFGTNPLVSQSDTTEGKEALAALEFHVHCDLFLTPSAQNADIFLPINTPWEREGLRVGFEINDEAASLVQLRQQFVSSRGEARSDNDIVFDLACRLGMEKQFFGGSLKKGWDYMLEPANLSVEKLRAAPRGIHCEIDAREQKYALPHHDGSPRVRGFDTETRRVEIYSALLHRHGQPAVARYLPVQRDAEMADRKFPLTLSSAKNGYYCHSQHRSLVSLRKRAPDPVAEISPALAQSRGIHENDWIVISTHSGEARFVARVTPEMSDDVVVAEFGWWQSCEELDRPHSGVDGAANSNFNHLISAKTHDPVSGSVSHRATACNIVLDPRVEKRQRGWSGTKKFRVTELIAVAESVTGVRIEPVDGSMLPDYRPGQHIQVSAPLADGTLSRAYSLTGAASIRQRRGFSIAVRHQKGIGSDGLPFQGRMSSHINTSLKIGDLVDVKSPSGQFVLPRSHKQPLILLAGGIGITPFISLLESLPDDCENEIHLLFANLNSATHAFKDRIREHQGRLPNLEVTNHYDRPLVTDVLGVDYDSERFITSDIVPEELIAKRPRIYMCGPPKMMENFANGLQLRGVPKFDIFHEVFKSPTEVAIDGGRTFEVRFLNSKKDAVRWSPKDGTLLSFAESLGLELASGCRVGQCESCSVKVVSGKVRHLHGQEPEDENECLTCQAVPTEDIVLLA